MCAGDEDTDKVKLRMVATRFPTVQLNFARPAEQWTEGVGQGLQPLSPLAEGEDIRPRAGLSLRPEARVGWLRPHRQACRLRAYRLQTMETMVPQVVYRHGGAMVGI